MKKKYLSSLILVILFNSGQSFAQTQTSTNSCNDPLKRSSRDSTCINGSSLVVAKQVGSSVMGVAKGTSYITLNLGVYCTTPWGAMIGESQVINAYLEPSSTECKTEKRYCMNGTLSGSYQYSTCNAPSSPPPPLNPPVSDACATTYGAVPIGTEVETCEMSGSGPNPMGEMYQCVQGGSWVLTKPGNPAIMVNCR